MAKGERVVFDTNVIVSALLIKASVARRCLDKARRGTIRVNTFPIQSLTLQLW